MTFDEFRREGKTEFAELDHIRIWSELKGLDFGASLIISSFSDDEVVHLTVESDGSVQWPPHFAASGSGARLCNAFLRQRDYFDSMSMEECVYTVLEAKIAAERDRYVGKHTDILIMGPGSKEEWVSNQCLEHLRRIIEVRRDTPQAVTIQFEPKPKRDTNTAADGSEN